MTTIESGARNAVAVCMGVGQSDRVVVITDHARQNIGLALAAESEARGAETRVYLMEDFVPRPASGYSSELGEQFESFKPTVSLFAATALEGELAFRRPMMNQLIYDMKARHGHMVGIDDRLMVEGMSADYNQIARITHQVNEAVKDSREIEVEAPSGTHMRATFDSNRRRWRPCPGLYHSPGDWGNLPEGETFTSPITVDGVVGAEVIGDHFSQKYGVLEEPVRIEIAGGRIRKVQSSHVQLREELESYFGQHENSNRVGEYAIGTNVALNALSGNLLQDEKIPGVHIAFGYPYPNETGADWDCSSHCDVVATRSTIKVDGQHIMRNGRFVI